MIADRVRSAGVELESLSALLDFGCGCGRIARHWAGLDGPAIHGCDYNPELVQWCQRNLPFLDARRNDLTPPLPYADRTFDLVYAVSVFTHLPIELQGFWITEMTRILAPGGLLLVTLHGDRQASEHLHGRRRREYEAGDPVVVNPALAGTNGCAAFHPPRYARETLLANLEVVLALPSTAVPEVDQDLYLGRRR
jgi:SAM-dependent methyltransferase